MLWCAGASVQQNGVFHDRIIANHQHSSRCFSLLLVFYIRLQYMLGFYKRMNLPLPRLCSNCRYRKRNEFGNPMRLWTRVCQCAGDKSVNGIYTNTGVHYHGSGGCQLHFETSYDPSRPEIVYCEKCYQQEVY